MCFSCLLNANDREHFSGSLLLLVERALKSWWRSPAVPVLGRLREEDPGVQDQPGLGSETSSKPNQTKPQQCQIWVSLLPVAASAAELPLHGPPSAAGCPSCPPGPPLPAGSQTGRSSPPSAHVTVSAAGSDSNVSLVTAHLQDGAGQCSNVCKGSRRTVRLPRSGDGWGSPQGGRQPTATWRLGRTPTTTGLCTFSLSVLLPLVLGIKP